jgi:hypothetical protein
LALFILVVCAIGDVAMPASPSSELQQWSTAAGKPPSKESSGWKLGPVVNYCEGTRKARLSWNDTQ